MRTLLITILIAVALFLACSGCQEQEKVKSDLPENWTSIYGEDVQSKLTYNLARHALRANARLDKLEKSPADPNQTDWLGCPSLARPDGYHLNEFVRPDTEIGCRADGLVIWRDISPSIKTVIVKGTDSEMTSDPNVTSE